MVVTKDGCVAPLPPRRGYGKAWEDFSIELVVESSTVPRDSRCPSPMVEATNEAMASRDVPAARSLVRESKGEGTTVFPFFFGAVCAGDTGGGAVAGGETARVERGGGSGAVAGGGAAVS